MIFAFSVTLLTIHKKCKEPTFHLKGSPQNLIFDFPIFFVTQRPSFPITRTHKFSPVLSFSLYIGYFLLSSLLFNNLFYLLKKASAQWKKVCNKKTPTEWEKMFSHNISDKILISKVHKLLTKLTNKNFNNPIYKCSSKIDTSLKKIYGQQIYEKS